jgi:ABC-2 type transport system ATP-binding protein
MNAVELSDVSKQFGRTQALEKISLKVAQGEVVALLGPNGAGKTTAISLMLGLRQPNTGTVKIFGANPKESASRLRVGAMLQESELPGSLKAIEILELFARQYANPLKVSNALELAGLTSEANKLAQTLSGGQRKRLCFALAMIGNPDLLFLDEPTAALDVEARRTFWASVDTLIAQGKTIILTTHYLEEADALAKRIVVIAKGKIVADGTPAQIKAHSTGKLVKFQTTTALSPLENTKNWQVRGQQIQFMTNTPEAILQKLFANGVEIEHLEVQGVGLEEAFMDITRDAV